MAYSTQFQPLHTAYPNEVLVGSIKNARFQLGPRALGIMAAGVLLTGALMTLGHFAHFSSSAKSLTEPEAVKPLAVSLRTTPTTVTVPTPTGTPAATLKPNPPKSDSANLQAILNSWQKEYDGGSYGVVVKELGPRRGQASLASHDVFGMASLYKLFLARYMYTSIEAGRFSPANWLGDMSKSIGSCLESMIVLSENDCPYQMASAVGWSNFNQSTRAAGFNETVVSPVNTTTASDIANYLIKLQAGRLMSKSSASALLGNMRRQIYRSGIPAGAPGVDVADKVGIFKGNYHDAAIVYHPKGTYVLVILSRHSSVAAVKELSRRINDFLNGQ